MSLPKDWKEFLQLLNSRGAEYVVVGAFALAFHSEPRFTGDLDLLIHIIERRKTPTGLSRPSMSLASARSVSLARICYWRVTSYSLASSLIGSTY